MKEKIELRYKLVPFDQLTRFEKMSVGICCPESLRYEILNMHGELYINSDNPHCQEITELIKRLEKVEYLDKGGDEILEKICEYTHSEAMTEVYNLWRQLLENQRKQEGRKAAAMWYETNAPRFMYDDEEFTSYLDTHFIVGLFDEVEKQFKNNHNTRNNGFSKIKALESVFLAGFDAGQESRCGRNA